jgi:Secretion system C-terminal sorting domain
VNRKLEVKGDSILTAFCYNACTTCAGVGTNDLAVDNLFTVQPTIADEQVTLFFGEHFDGNTKQINLISMDGRRVASYTIAANTRQQSILVDALPNGLYLLQAQSGTSFQTEKIVVSH